MKIFMEMIKETTIMTNTVSALSTIVVLLLWFIFFVAKNYELDYESLINVVINQFVGLITGAIIATLWLI